MPSGLGLYIEQLAIRRVEVSVLYIQVDIGDVRLHRIQQSADNINPRLPQLLFRVQAFGNVADNRYESDDVSRVVATIIPGDFNGNYLAGSCLLSAGIRR